MSLKMPAAVLDRSRAGGYTGVVEPIPETSEALDQLGQEGDPALREDLQWLVDRALAHVPGLVGVSLGLTIQDLVLTYVASGVEVAALDGVRAAGDGRCLDAFRDGHVVRAEHAALFDEAAWQLFAQSSAAVGIRSTLSIPVRHNGVVTGGVDLYGDAADTFDGRADEMAELFGAWAPGAVANADVSFATRQEATQGPKRLQEQRVVDQAIGLLVGAAPLDPVVAERRLHAAAARAGVSVAVLARALVDPSTDPA